MTEGGKWDRAKFKLKPHSVIPETDKPVLVIVLDGFGEDREDEFNAAFKAHMPCLNGLKQNKPNTYTLVKAHGTAVGLPSDADMGNSEVNFVITSSSARVSSRLTLSVGFVAEATHHAAGRSQLCFCYLRKYYLHCYCTFTSFSAGLLPCENTTYRRHRHLVLGLAPRQVRS